MLRVLIDRGSVEVFGNAGRVAMSVAHIAPEKDMTVTAAGVGEIEVVWRPMKSAWK